MTTLYHLSRSPDLKILIPAIPAKLLAKSNKKETKRISFSSSVNGYILGLQFNERLDFPNGEVELFVYTPIKDQLLKWKSNQELVDNKLVFDAHITKECWCLDPVCVSNIGSIIVSKEISKTIEFSPLKVDDSKYLKSNGKLDTFLYKYKWSK